MGDPCVWDCVSARRQCATCAARHMFGKPVLILRRATEASKEILYASLRDSPNFLKATCDISPAVPGIPNHSVSTLIW